MLACNAFVVENARIFPIMFMISRRLLSSIATAAVCLSIMQPAFAATASSDDMLAQLKTFDPNTVCEGRTGKNLGKCIGDVVKRISGLRADFNRALQSERDAWYAANGNLGIDAPYRTALEAYLANVQAKRDAFTAAQRTLEKAFYSTRKDVLDSGLTATGSTVTPTTPSAPVTPTDINSATAACAKQAESRSLRICLRLQLRLQNMTSPLKNISPTGSRTTN